MAIAMALAALSAEVGEVTRFAKCRLQSRILGHVSFLESKEGRRNDLVKVGKPYLSLRVRFLKLNQMLVNQDAFPTQRNTL